MVVPARRVRRIGIPKPRAIQLRIVKLLWMVGRRMRFKQIFVLRAELHNICEGKGSGIFVSGDESRPPTPERVRAHTEHGRSFDVRRTANDVYAQHGRSPTLMKESVSSVNTRAMFDARSMISCAKSGCASSSASSPLLLK